MFDKLLEKCMGGSWVQRGGGVVEAKVYTEPFWNYLVHESGSAENRQSILQSGFNYTTNPNILRGIYAVPDEWYKPLGIGYPVKIYTKRGTRIFDNGADRPMSALRGIGTVKFNEVYVGILNQLGYDLPYSDRDENWNWYRRNEGPIEKFLDNWEDRKKYQRGLRKFLVGNDYKVYINGGEVIIVNKTCIDRVEKGNVNV